MHLVGKSLSFLVNSAKMAIDLGNSAKAKITGRNFHGRISITFRPTELPWNFGLA